MGPETEHIFGDSFFSDVDFVANALDNVEARRYVDGRCVAYGIPLLESGTLGTKGNTQVCLPHLTESYSSSSDPPERSIPMCTLHNFPSSPEHCIEWARDLFAGCFVADPETIASILSSQPSPNGNKGQSVQTVDESKVATSLSPDQLKTAIKFLKDIPRGWEDCVKWARRKFEVLFVHGPLALLHAFPRDARQPDGTLFWSGAKRAPQALQFPNKKDDKGEMPTATTENTPTSTTSVSSFGSTGGQMIVSPPSPLAFVRETAILSAALHGIKPTEGDLSDQQILEIASQTAMPPFRPPSVNTEDKEVIVKASTGDGEIDSEDQTQLRSLLLAELHKRAANGDLERISPLQFEKDDDTNHHVDWLWACAGMRAAVYGIDFVDRSRVKQVAGKIIPAIATTTAVVAGLVSLELYKLVSHTSTKSDGQHGGSKSASWPYKQQATSGGRKRALDSIDSSVPFRNAFVNLALPFVAFSEPLSAPRHKVPFC